MFSINIDTSRPKPAPKKAFGRCPINFDVTIDDKGTRKDIKRDLTRVPIFVPDEFPIVLGLEFVDLSVPSTPFQGGDNNLQYAVEYVFTLPTNMTTSPDFYE